MKHTKMRQLAISLALAAVVALAACQPAPPAPVSTTSLPQPTTTQANVLQKGVTLTPRSFQTPDFTDFFAKAKQAGIIVTWAGDWSEFGSENGGPNVLTGLSVQYSFTPIAEAQFFSQSTGQLLRPLDDATRKEYEESIVNFAAQNRPRYLGIGIEVNVLYEKSPADFDAFVQFYAEVYAAVKTKSPDTAVFTVLQLERMKGMRGGLFGGTNGQAEWSLLDRFPTDIAAFTTYPCLVFKSPSEIPDDYYAEIRTHTTKPVAFTEVGWYTTADIQGWESSEQEQVDFINTFFRLTHPLDARVAVWSFLYDQQTTAPFNSMGLFRADGTARPAWDAWMEER